MSIPPFLALPQGVIPDTIEVADAALAVLKVEPPVAHHRVLLAPGFTGSKEDFIGVLPLLGQREVHAISYDHIGQFESRSDATGERFSIDNLASDMVTLSRQLWPRGPRPHLVGHSLGGLVARRAVLADPSAFTSVTLMSSGPQRVPESQQEALLLLQSLIGQADLQTIWELKSARDRQLGLPEPEPQMAAFLQRRWVTNNPESLRAKAAILTGEPDLVDALRATSVPVHVVTGTLDDVWPPQAQEQMAQRLRARHSWITGAAHAPASDDPVSTVERMLEFWESLEYGSRPAG